jgi:hypothetical protein
MNMYRLPRDPGKPSRAERPKKPISVEHELNYIQLQWHAGLKPYVTKQTACKIWNCSEFEAHIAAKDGHLPKPILHFGEYCYTLATVMQRLLLKPNLHRGLDFLEDPFAA